MDCFDLLDVERPEITSFKHCLALAENTCHMSVRRSILRCAEVWLSLRKESFWFVLIIAIYNSNKLILIIMDAIISCL